MRGPKPENIVEEPVRPVRVRWMCGCGGEMISNGTCYPVSPPLHGHDCTMCGRSETASAVYPHIAWKSDMTSATSDDIAEALLRNSRT